MNPTKSRVLITGASGYLGSKLMERLQLSFEVTGWDIQPSADMRVRQVDVCDQRRVAEQWPDGTDFVVNAAALVPKSKAGSAFFGVNHRGAGIVSAEAKARGVKHLVQISSSAIFNPPPKGPIVESAVPSPYERYGWSKFLGEREVAKELNESSTSFTILRPRTIVGPDRGGLFDVLFRWIIADLPLPVLGHAENPYQLIHLDDFVSAIELCLKNQISGKFNLGSRSFEPLSLELNSLIQYANSTSRLLRFPEKPSRFLGLAASKLGVLPFGDYQIKTYGRSFFFSDSKLLDHGWTPNFSNDESLKSAFDSYREWSQIENENNLGHLRSRMKTGLVESLLRSVKSTWR